jgi:hypothetical protein
MNLQKVPAKINARHDFIQVRKLPPKRPDLFGNKSPFAASHQQ